MQFTVSFHWQTSKDGPSVSRSHRRTHTGAPGFTFCRKYTCIISNLPHLVLLEAKCPGVGPTHHHETAWGERRVDGNSISLANAAGASTAGALSAGTGASALRSRRRGEACRKLRPAPDQARREPARQMVGRCRSPRWSPAARRE